MQLTAYGKLAVFLFLLLPHFCSQAESSQPVRTHLLRQFVFEEAVVDKLLQNAT